MSKESLKPVVKRITGIACLLLLFVITGVFVGCGSPESKQQKYIKKALIYANLGKFEKSQNVMKAALEKYPDSVELHFNYGNILARQKKFEAAIEQFNTTLKLDPNHYQTYLQLARVYADQETYDKALEYADKSLAIKNDYAVAFEFRGAVHERLGQNEEALKDYDKYIALNPSKPEGYLRKASLFLIMNDQEKAKEQCLKITNDIEKSNVQAILILSLIYDMEGKINEAVALIEGGLADKPNSLQFLNRLSELYLKQGDYEKAMSTAQKALAINSKAAGARYVKGSVHFIRQEYEKAAIEFENFFDPPPIYGDLFYKLGLCYLEMDKPQQGINELKKMIERSPNFVPAYFTLAFAYLREGWADDAIKLCKQGLELSPNNIKGVEILAKASIAQKNFKEAEKYFDQLVQHRPDNVADILSLASLKINKGDIDVAYDLCNRVLEINEKNVNAHSLKGFCYLRQGKIDDAITEFRKVIEIDPLNIGGHLNLAKIYSSVQRFNEAEEELLNLIELKPDFTEVFAELGNLYFVQGKYDKSIEYYTRILQNNPQDLKTNIALAGAYYAKDEFNKALAILEPFQRNPKFDDNVQLRSFLATLYYKLNDPEKAEREYKKVLAVNPRFRPAYDLGLIYTDQGKTEESIEIYKQALKIDPNLTDMMLYLAIAQQHTGDYDKAEETLSRLINIEPQNYSLYFIHINILAAKGDTVKAKEILDKIPELSDEIRNAYNDVIKLNQTDPMLGKKLTYMLNQMKVYRTRGWTDQAVSMANEAIDIVPANILPMAFLVEVYMADGDLPKAQEILDKMLVVNENSIVANLRYSRLQAMRGDIKKSIEYMEKVNTITPDQSFLLLDLGVLYERDNQIDKAVELYNKVIELQPNSFRAMNNLAWLLTEHKKDYATALNYAEQAAELAPKNGAVLDTYGWILYMKGDYEKAISVLERAAAYLPSNPTVAYHLGKAFIAVNNEEKALFSLEKAIDINIDFPEKEETLKLLEQLKMTLSK